MMNQPSVRQRSKSSEGSIWSKVSFLFRLVLFVGMLPLIFPESEAHVTNLHLPHSAEYRRRVIPDLLNLQNNIWQALPLRRLPKASTTDDVERIRTNYAGPTASHRHPNASERQSLGFLPWLLIVASACYICLKYQRWRLILSVGFLLMHFALEERIFQFSFRSLLAWYMTQLSSSPILTKSITAGLIGTIGDYTAQWLEHILSVRHQARKQPVATVRDACAAPTFDDATIEPSKSTFPILSIHGRYDVRRGVSILADGLFISGPLMHFGYEVFEWILPIADAGSADPASALAAILHVVADSLLLDSFFIASRFFATGLMEGVSLLELFRLFKIIYVPSLQASWATSLVLCPVQFSCFRYLPLSVRVLSVNCIDVIWDAVLSFMAHRSR